MVKKLLTGADASSNKIVNVADPTSAQDAATKNYVDAGTSTLTNKNLTSPTNTFPTFNQNTTGTAANVTGTVAVANGGTGLTTAVAGQLLFGKGTSAIGQSANLFWDNTNNILGIGTNSPSTIGVTGPQFVSKNWTTATSGNYIPNYFLSQLSPSATAYTTQLNGLNSFAEIPSGVTVDGGTGASGATGLVRGGWYTAYNSSARSVNDVYGTTSESGLQTGAAGTITYAYGAHGLVSNKGSGTISKAFPVFSEIYSAGTGTITQAVSFYSNLTYSSGTVTTFTALQNDDMSANVGNQYGVLLFGRSMLGSSSITPTAVLHLIAGKATAGWAPLKFTAGVNLTTPEAGAVEFDGTSLTYTDSTPTRRTLTTNDGTQTLTNKTLTSPVISTITNAGTLTLPTSSDTLVGRATTDTLTNKRITQRTATLTVATSTYTPNGDTTDLAIISSPTAAFTVATPTGTPTDGQQLMLRIKSGATGYAPTWGTGYQSSGVATLPTAALPASKTVTFGFTYDAAAAKFVLLAYDGTGY